MNKKNTLIFIPGFKGSMLVNQEGKKVWPNVIKSQFDHSNTLCNHIPTIDITNPMRFKSSEIVGAVDVIPGIYKIDFYANAFQKLHKRLPADTELIPFHYDWRQDLMITAPRLKSLIERLYKEKNEIIDIVCHSMGGLITSYVLQMLSRLVIRRVFFVGVPFKGTLKALLDLMYGTPFGLNKTLLSPKAMASFASLYYLLPRYEDAIPRYSLFDIKTWEKFKLGFLMHDENKQKKDFLEQQLTRVSAFYDDLEHKKNKIGAQKLISVNSYAYSTPCHLQLERGMNIIKQAGDGSVPAVSLALPDYLKSIPHENYHIQPPHAKSFHSEKLINLIVKP